MSQTLPLGGGKGVLASIHRPRTPTAPHRAALVVTAAKKKRGPKPDGPASSSAGGGGSDKVKLKSGGAVREGAAYGQETRKTILTMNRVSKVTPTGKTLLSNVSLGYYLGAKIGILGANGAGKSTLMKILAGVDQDIDGEIERAPGIRVGYLEQEPKLDAGETVMSNIEPAVQRVKDMVAEFESVSAEMATDGADVETLMAKMEKLQNDLDANNAWEIDRFVEQAMDALRCPPGDARVADLSGGERRRVALCRLVLENPDVLLLDEPTNHLDAESVAWLEQYLSRFPGTVVAITHDRYFLDNVAGWILELDRGQGLPFEGNYSEWLNAKEKRLSQEKKEQSALRRTMESELAWMNSNAKGQQKKGQARVNRYEDLAAQAASYIQNSQVDTITIPIGPRLGSDVVRFEGVSKSFDDKLLLEKLDVEIPSCAVVGIVGPNGAGKSTLFRMIMGEQQPDKGSVTVGSTVTPMYVEQSREALDENNKTLVEEVGGGADLLNLGGREVNVRAYCYWYNFKGADQQKQVSMLSGGERNRLMLAKTLQKSGNLLLLDEPTNDLDVDTLRALEEAINNFAGTVLCISHDRWFLDRICTHILAFEGESTATFFTGNYSEYAEDWRKRNGGKDPTRIKFRKLANM
jgi:energy-dependent translational throttle protein EttA